MYPYARLHPAASKLPAAVRRAVLLLEEDEGGGNALEKARTLGFNFASGSMAPTKGSASLSFTRGTTKVLPDYEGSPRQLLAGEVDFTGHYRVENLLRYPEDFSNAVWQVAQTGTAAIGVKTPNYGLAPDGTMTACRVQLDVSAGSVNNQSQMFQLFTTTPSLVSGCWIRTTDGSTKTIMPFLASGPVLTVTGAWQRIASPLLAGSGIQFLLVNGTTSATADLLVWHPMSQNVAGASNQIIGPYVSRDVLAAPYLQTAFGKTYCCNVDGVAHFDFLNGNTVSNNVVTEAKGAVIPKSGVGIGRTPVVASTASFFSTPSSAALQITDRVTLFGWVQADAWNTNGEIVVKYDGANVQYDLFLSAGILNSRYYNGTTTRTAAAGVAMSTLVANAVGLWVAVDIQSNNGAGGRTFTFYYSGDGTNWTMIGTPATTAGAESIGTTAGPLSVMGATGATALPGSVFRAGVRAGGLTGTLVADFTPSAWSTGATFVSSTTGETWTLNGGARINKWPPGRRPEVASTNLVLQNSNFNTTWAASGTPTVAAAAPLGSIAMQTIGDDDAGGQESFSQTITLTGDAVKAHSLFFRQGTSASTLIRLLDTTAPAEKLLATITWTNGLPVITILTASGTLLTGNTGQPGWEPYMNGFRLLVNCLSVTAGNTHSLRVYPAATGTGDVSSVGTIDVGGVQVENSPVVSSAIPTTTTTLSRSKDDMVVTSLGAWFNPLAGTLVASVVVPTGAPSGVEGIASLNGGSSVNRITLYRAGTGQQVISVAGALQSNLNGGLLTANISAKLATVYALNDVELYVNGVRAGTGDQVGTVPTVSQLEIGSIDGLANQFCGILQSLDYYNSRVANSDLAALTA